MYRIFLRYNPIAPLESRISSDPAAGPGLTEKQMQTIKRHFQNRSSAQLDAYLREEGLIPSDGADAMLANARKVLKPWESEPDSLSFEHRGIECRIRRMSWSGHLCGYARLPDAHPWVAYSLDYPPARVHGGITYGPRVLDGEEGIWIGFDCAHSGDLTPKAPLRDQHGTYRDLAYVRAECESLAEQIRAAEAE